jgi:hypothetical protein
VNFVDSEWPTYVAKALLGVWMVICLHLVISRWADGFSELVAHYGFPASFGGRKWLWRSARIGGFHYYGVMVGLNATGLYISCPWLYQEAHPPILIPWSELQVEAPPPRRGSQTYQLSALAVPQVKIRLSQRLFQTLAVASNGRLSSELPR